MPTITATSSQEQPSIGVLLGKAEMSTVHKHAEIYNSIFMLTRIDWLAIRANKETQLRA